MKKYYSCKDIEGSLYIAPNEIRACCQRFFYKGEMRGDVNFLKLKMRPHQMLKILLILEKNFLKNSNKMSSLVMDVFLYKTEKNQILILISNIYL